MPSLRDTLRAERAQLEADGLYRELQTVSSPQGPRVVVDGRELLNFSSNDYLCLANDPVLKRAAREAVERWGVGAGASRLVSGNLAPYGELETKLARFKQKETAIVFGSGYVANVGTITALVGAGDTVILDKLDHASIIDGARQSGATVRVYPHGNVKKLEEILHRATGRVLVVTETIFSMDGDTARLAEIVALKEKYAAWLMVDEAHATGVFGPHRRGWAEVSGVEDKVDVTLGTLSKAFGCVGGYVAGSRELIDHLRNRARSLIYSTALPPAMVAAASAAVDFVMSEVGQQRQEQLWANVRALGATGPIHPVIVGDEADAMALSRRLYEAGFFVPAIRYPTVARGKARLRVTVSAAHTVVDIARLQEALGTGRGQKPAPTTAAEVRPASVGATFRSRPARLPHARDLRRGRVSLPGECYFITTCVAGRQPVFAGPAAAKMIVNALRWLRDEGRIRLLGFVVMPDHLHVALALRSRAETRSHALPEEPCGNGLVVATLPDVMRSLKGFTGKMLVEQLGVNGPLWQEGYHDHLLRGRQEFEERLAYMHDNPLRKGLVSRADEWLFSTAHPEYAQEIDWAWVEGVPT